MTPFRSLKILPGWFHILALPCLICLAGIGTLAQSPNSVTVTVHVNRLPTGAYPTKLYQFSSMPGLVTVMLTNLTGNAVTLYLNGAVTGDNGVQIVTAKGYQPASIRLKPLEVRTLNAIEAGSLFDPNGLIFLSGNASIRPTVFGEQGLPEGTYQICVRAYDAATRQPLSEEDPIGCSNIFTVSTLEAPVILSPVDEDTLSTPGPQNVMLRWTTPPGAPPSTQYRILIDEAFNDAIPAQAVIASTARPFFDYTVQGPPMLLYSLQYPALVKGRTYAMEIIASDPLGNTTFRNKGTSEAIRFTYGRSIPGIGGITMNFMDAPAQLKCACTKPPTGAAINVSAIKVGDVLQIDGFDMEITNLLSSPNSMTLVGEGKIKVPILKLVPVKVNFMTGIQINASKQVVSGKVIGERRGDAASVLPVYDPSQPNLTLDPNTVQNFSAYISQYVASQNPSQSLVYQLPIGLNNLTASDITVAITDITFTPDAAAFNAGAAMDIPEANMTIALGAGNICFAPDQAICGTGTIYLEKDLNLASTNISLKGQAGADPGTFIEFDQDGSKHLHIEGQYNFPPGLLVAKTGGQASAVLTADGISWSDWIASIKMDPFMMAGNSDFTFAPNTMYYDHSDKQNPPGIPATYTDAQAPTWRGFFMPLMSVTLPSIIRKFDNSPFQVQAQNFIYDERNGLSGTLAAANVLDIGSGSLGSWAYSVDHIDATFIKNSFTTGDMSGKVVLPIVNPNDQASWLNYTCLLTDQNGLQFQFSITPNADIHVPLWLVQLKLASSSNISVTAGGGSGFKAKAVLNGDLSFDANLPSPLGHVDMTLISFQNLTINSSAPYISDGQITTGQSSPAKFLDGLPVSFKETPSFVFNSPTSIGLRVPLEVTLTDDQSLPTADFTFTITGGLNVDAHGRVTPNLKPVLTPEKVHVQGDLGPVYVQGGIDFFDNDPQWGSGIDGGLTAIFQPGFSVTATALFGKNNYSYFFVGANVILPPPGIPIGGGIIPLSVFGFGGGLYHNIKLNLVPDQQHSLITGGDPKQMFSLSQGTTGFMGSITLGSTDEHILVTTGVLDAELGNNMALQSLTIGMQAGMFVTDPSNVNSGVAHGNGYINYDFSQKQLNGQASLDVEIPGGFVKGSGTLALMANFGNTGDWYFKIGDPEPEDKRVTLDLKGPAPLDLNFKAYLNVGKNLQLPTDLQNVYDGIQSKLVGSTSYTDPITNTPKPVPLTTGLMLGASAAAGFNLQFLIFYANLTGSLGFDLALIQNSAPCPGGGMNKYYALGAVNAGLQFDMGIQVDVWFLHGKVSFVSTDLQASITAGFPNPLVLQGWIEGQFSVLDNLISGNMHFKVSYSSGKAGSCAVSSNPFGDLPLISGVYPGDRDTGVSIMSNINVAFNFPVNQPFDVQTADQGKMRLMVVIKNLSVSEMGVKGGYIYGGQMDVNGNSITQGGATIYAINHDATLYGWTNAFDPATKHVIQLMVSGMKLDLATGKWTEQAHMDSTLQFTTGGCVERLDEVIAFPQPDGPPIMATPVRASYPLPNQRYFLPKQVDHGYIQVKAAIPCLDNGPSHLLSTINEVVRYDLYAKFISEKDHFESPVTQQGTFLNFSIPDLSPSTVYKCQIVKRPVYSGNPPINLSQFQNNSVDTRTVTLGIDPSDAAKNNYAIVRNYTAEATVSSKTTNDIEIYRYYFRTSRFKTLQEKMGGASQSGSVTWGLMMPSFQISMVEGLDQYDALGYSYDGGVMGEHDWLIPPLVHLDEKYSDNPWMLRIITPLVTSYDVISPYDPSAGTNSMWKLISPLGRQNNFLSTMVSGYEPFVASGYDPPLRSDEIPITLKLGMGQVLLTPATVGIGKPAVTIPTQFMTPKTETNVRIKP